MNELSGAGAKNGLRQDAISYLDRDVFFNRRIGQLVCGKTVVALNLHENTLLQLLLTDRVRKQQVIDVVWGANGTIVTEASYHQLVRSLRKKFDEAGLNPLSIKTLPRYGLEYLREQLSPVTAEGSRIGVTASTASETDPVSLTVAPALPHVDSGNRLCAGKDAHADDHADAGSVIVTASSETARTTADATADANADAIIRPTASFIAYSISHPSAGAVSGTPLQQLLPLLLQTLLLALPLLVAFYFSLMTYLTAQAPMQSVANDWGIHLFDIGGAQYDPKLWREIKRRSSRGEYVYVARNGPKAWLGICATPAHKGFSFCHQNYFSLY